jgi:hypothetical protein
LTKENKETVEKIAFVICPIGEPGSDARKRSDTVLKYIIEPPLKECGYEALRADKISEPGRITSQVITHLLNDPLVVADLTDHNPNVFYELAVRHAIRKPVVQLIQEGQKIPFDVADQRTIEVNLDVESADEAKKELTKQIHVVEKDPTKVDSPISDAIDLQALRQSEDPQLNALAEIRATLQAVYASTTDIKTTMLADRQEMMHSRIQQAFPGFVAEAESGRKDAIPKVLYDPGLVRLRLVPTRTPIKEKKKEDDK